MTSPDTIPADLLDAETAHRVLREQVVALHAITWSSTLAGTLLACALCAIFYWRLRDPMVLVWLSLVFLQLLRYPQAAAYHTDPRAAQRSEYWARHKARELFFYSSLWGLAPWLFMPANDVPMTTLLMLMILGLCTGGVPAVAPRWSTTLSFLLPMVLGLITALAWRGDDVHLFLAACSAVYLGATLHFAHQQHLLLTQSLLMRFEKEALADELAQQMAITEHASQEKTRFFASASHDLRQPLHAIALFGAVLQKELQAHPAQANATRLMRAVHALGTSLDTMLDISRLDAGVIETHVRDVPLNPMLQSINQMFATRADEKGLQLRLRASPLWVRTDPELLQRLLTNLVENAIKYTVQGGVLVVARQRGTTTWIDVCDTGVGIAPEQQGKIFDEFYQVSNPGRDRSQGLGIGLSIVRRLSNLLGHRVEVHSRPGQGSRFRLKLLTAPAQFPARTRNPIPDVELSPATEAGPILPRRVLMIDDEADIGHAVSALLEAHGSQLQVVRDETAAAAAFIQANHQGQPFQAMLCDYRLADGADGLAAAQRLRTRFHPQLPLLLVTGETAPERLRQLRNSGVPVLFKPVPANILLQALVELTCPKAQPSGI